MGVPADQLLLDPRNGLGERELARALEDHQKEDPEIQGIANLLPELHGVAAREGVEDLVRLLDHKGRKTFGSLCAIPGTAVRALEYLADIDQALPQVAQIRFARCHAGTISCRGEGVLHR